MKQTRKDVEKAEAIAQLREWIKPGDTVYTILDHVSASGMSRAIRVLIPMIGGTTVKSAAPGSKPTDYIRLDSISVDFRHPNWTVGKALGLRHWKRNGREQDALVLGGCGMDMGFHLVYELSRVMHPAGFGCIGKGCPSNDHSNGDRDYTAHTCIGDTAESGNDYYTAHQHKPAPIARGKHGVCHWHTDGGYAIRHRWL